MAEAVAKANVNLPTGTLHGAQQALTVQASGQLTQAEQYNSVIVTYRDGRPVRLEDIGTAYNSVENDKVGRLVREPARRSSWPSSASPGPTPSRWPRGSRSCCPSCRRSCPPRSPCTSSTTASTSIEESVNDVKFTLLFTLGLVVLVIFLFLRNVSATR